MSKLPSKSKKIFHYLIKGIKKFNSNPTPNWIQTWSQIASVVFAIIAIILTKQYANQKQQIQDLDKVIEELVKQNKTSSEQNKNQNEELTELKNITDQNLQLIKDLDSIQRLLLAERYLIKVNTMPNLSLTGVFSFSRVQANKFVYRVEYINNGARAAENFQGTTGVVYLDGALSTFLMFKNQKILNTTIPPGQKGFIIDTFTINGRDYNHFNNVFFKQSLSCTDPISGEKINFAPSYYTHVSENDTIKATRFANASEKKLIDKLIKQRNRKHDITD